MRITSFTLYKLLEKHLKCKFPATNTFCPSKMVRLLNIYELFWKLLCALYKIAITFGSRCLLIIRNMPSHNGSFAFFFFITSPPCTQIHGFSPFHIGPTAIRVARQLYPLWKSNTYRKNIRATTHVWPDHRQPRRPSLFIYLTVS